MGCDDLNPKISVIMPVYNVERYVTTAIESIQNQTCHEWELIAVDDHSADSSYFILQTIAANDERIRIYRNQETLG